MDLALADAFFGDRFHDLLAAAAQLGEVKLALFVSKLAVTALFDAVRQIFGDVFLQTTQEKRTQLRGEPAAGDALGGFSIFAARLIGRGEMVLVAEIVWLNKVDDTPQIQQSILQGRARERKPVLGFQLLYGLRDLCPGVFDELRFVEDHRAKRKLLQFLEITAKKRVIR